MITERRWFLPPFLAWTNMLFKACSTEWAADEKAGCSCCCCCFADAVAFHSGAAAVSTGVTSGRAQTLIGLRSFRTQSYVSGSYSFMSSSFKCFIFLRCCPNLFFVWLCSISSATSGNVLVLRVYWVQIQFRDDYFLLPAVVLVLYAAESKGQIDLISPDQTV